MGNLPYGLLSSQNGFPHLKLLNLRHAHGAQPGIGVFPNGIHIRHMREAFQNHAAQPHCRAGGMIGGVLQIDPAVIGVAPGVGGHIRTVGSDGGIGALTALLQEGGIDQLEHFRAVCIVPIRAGA